MTRLRYIVCSQCSKKFRTESGLRWHLYHIHDWKDTMKLMNEPSPAKLAHLAVMRELALTAYAKGYGVDVEYLKQLIEKHFGSQETAG